MRRPILNSLIDIAALACVWQGLFGGVTWAENLALFYAWFVVLISPLTFLVYLNKKGAAELQRLGRERPVWRKHASRGADIVMVLAFAAAGWFWSALFFALANLLMESTVAAAMDEERVSA